MVKINTLTIDNINLIGAYLQGNQNKGILWEIAEKERKMTPYEIRIIAEKIVEEMGGDANEICGGNCPDFAKRLIDSVGEGQIVSNLEAAMESELDGYEVVKPEDSWPNPNSIKGMNCSHCWVKIGELNYDAFNPEGVEYESDLEFYQKNV